MLDAIGVWNATDAAMNDRGRSEEANEDLSDPIFGEWLRWERDRRGWSSAELSRRSGISGGRLSELISNKRKVGPRLAGRLADALNIDIETIYKAAGLLPHDLGTISANEAQQQVYREELIGLVNRIRWDRQRSQAISSQLRLFRQFDLELQDEDEDE